MKRTIKKKSKKINFNNPTTRRLINALRLSENRLSSRDIISFSNKTLFYQLKKAGYIKETRKGAAIYTATEKLKRELSKHAGTVLLFGQSSSPDHSAAISQSLLLLPRSALAQFKSTSSGADLSQNFKQLMGSYKFQKAFFRHMEQLTCQTSNHQNNLNDLRQEPLSQKTLNAIMAEKKSLYDCQKSLQLLKSCHPCSVPDYAITMTRVETLQAITNYLQFLNSLPKNRQTAKTRTLYENASARMSSALASSPASDTFRFEFEIITTHYSSRDIERHENYERLTGKIIIFIN